MDFVIDLDNIWKWLGFSQKARAKELLDKNFKIHIDYKVLLCRQEQTKGTRTKLFYNEGEYNIWKNDKIFHLIFSGFFSKICKEFGLKCKECQSIFDGFCSSICIAFGFSDNQCQSIFSGFFSNKCIAFGFEDKIVQFILLGFFSNKQIAFRLDDNSHKLIFSGFFSNNCIAFGLVDKILQLTFSRFSFNFLTVHSDLFFIS